MVILGTAAGAIDNLPMLLEATSAPSSSCAYELPTATPRFTYKMPWPPAKALRCKHARMRPLAMIGDPIGKRCIHVLL